MHFKQWHAENCVKKSFFIYVPKYARVNHRFLVIEHFEIHCGERAGRCPHSAVVVLKNALQAMACGKLRQKKSFFGIRSKHSCRVRAGTCTRYTYPTSLIKVHVPHVPSRTLCSSICGDLTNFLFWYYSKSQSLDLDFVERESRVSHATTKS